ncbi:hypothetical protein I6N96_01230 [Enterococcus sp. BWM-S5]|uniref:Uncharacterized protein n=1 Tax=Enterococcus larvae TaxID=2794352 RepID=A0ABS4CEP4_9ENTE|nr:hypothetical protein [Enterococcus larvae]MBP1044884.1 hypothetical protein [Enterococcus larvae]
MKKKHPYQRGYRKNTALITGEEAGWCTGWGIDGSFVSSCGEITSGLLYSGGQLKSVIVNPLLDKTSTEDKPEFISENISIKVETNIAELLDKTDSLHRLLVEAEVLMEEIGKFNLKVDVEI